MSVNYLSFILCSFFHKTNFFINLTESFVGDKTRSLGAAAVHVPQIGFVPNHTPRFLLNGPQFFRHRRTNSLLEYAVALS